MHYATSLSPCRSKQLVAYFGEKDAVRCGRCDVCLNRNRTQLSEWEFDEMPKWTPGMRYESRSGKVAKVLARVSKTIPIDVSVEGEEHEEVFLIVEHMPEFPGGDIALRKFIAENIKYPEEAKAKKIQGKVFVQFVIDKEGNVVSPKIARGADPLLDAEAIRVVKSLPKWEPGSQRGKPVNVSFTYPVTFSLDK